MSNMDEALWGKIETKVRRLVFDLLEPSINRVAEHKETLENMRRTDESLSKKIDNLEIITERLTKRVSLVDDFSRKIMQFDAIIKIQETTFAHDREEMKNELESFLKQLTTSEENIAILQGQTQNLRTDLVNFVFETNNSKQLISNRIEVVREEVIQMVKSLENKAYEFANHFVILDKKFSNFLTDFEEIDVIAKKAEHSGEDNSNQLKLIFKNFASFKKESKDNIDKVRQMSMQFSQSLTEQIKSVKDKFRLELPIMTQLQISENLHAVLELKNKKSLAELERAKFAEWELGQVPSFLEDRIYVAKERTQDVIDRPLPLPKQEPERHTAEVAVVEEEPPRPSPRPEKGSRRRSVRPAEVSRQAEESKNEISETEYEREGRISVPPKPVVIEIEKPAVSRKEKSEKLEVEAEVEVEGEKKFMQKVVEENEESSSEADRELSLEALQKNSEAIAKMMGIKDFTEDIDLLHEKIQRVQDDFKDSVKRLQNTDSGLDEKLQVILKKLYENSVKIDELKQYQQTMLEKAEADKVEIYGEITALHKKIETEGEKMLLKFEILSDDFTAISSKVNNNLDSLNDQFKKFTVKTDSAMELEGQKLAEFYDTITKTNQTLDMQIQQAALECNSAVTQRKRDHCDNMSEFRKIHQIFDSFHAKHESFNRSIDSFNRSLQLLVELSRITLVLLQQDESDRESIALFGVKDSKHASSRSISLSKPSITIDKQCLSCSGQPNFVTTAFKIACLAYSPTSVVFKETVYERSEMLEIQKRIIDGISGDTENDYAGLYEVSKQTYSLKPVQWRPLSRLSNLSISQPMVSATPDLPPLAFPKRNNH